MFSHTTFGTPHKSLYLDQWILELEH
jgi:hypothetical protein